MEESRLLDHLPASIELAAGSGKTWTLADNVRTIAENNGRALVLTHTVAGVHAMKAKLREFDIDISAYHVATITSLAVELVTSYSVHAGFDVPEIVDMKRSEEYINGAAAVLGHRHIREVFGASYTHLLVDEYQDCSKAQHSFVITAKGAIPQAVVLGDRLQGIFGFADPIVDWETDVKKDFPAFTLEQVPRRWRGHNEELGAWLFTLRARLIEGATLDFSKDLPRGVSFENKTAQGFELINAARKKRGQSESVVVITAPHVNSVRAVASRLQGYSAMEEMAGSFMLRQLTELTGLEPDGYSTWLAETTKKCFMGYSKLKLDKTVLTRLSKGQKVSTLVRPGLEITLAAFDRVTCAPNLDSLATAMDEIRISREASLHSREAWRDMTAVIQRCAQDSELGMVEELGHVREQVRRGGRGEQLRVVSRTVLIKGLEFDHVVIANIADISDACNLYVALTRARKTITIIGPNPRIKISETKKAPKAKSKALY